MSSVVDLSQVERGRRADIWRGSATSIFPGLSVRSIDADPAVGSIQHSRVGAGALIAIASAPVEVTYLPHVAEETDQFLTMMLQINGATIAHQRQRHCELARGDLCFIDERHPFRLVGVDCSEILLLRMPRAAVINRFPEMEHLVATLISGRDPGTSLLSQTLLHLMQIAGNLREGQQQATLNAIIHMLGAASSLAAGVDQLHWRVRKALDFIDRNLSTPGLTADQVAQAQHISRRRLDQLLHEALGESITGQIWSRRLQRAADDLSDRCQSGHSISQVAFANGFGDPAHFARVFKRRFGATPGQWRARAWTTTH